MSHLPKNQEILKDLLLESNQKAWWFQLTDQVLLLILHLLHLLLLKLLHPGFLDLKY
jgi:hypothetical protein